MLLLIESIALNRFLAIEQCLPSSEEKVLDMNLILAINSPLHSAGGAASARGAEFNIPY